MVSGIVTSNTFPNGLDYDNDGKSTIPLGDGFAGYSGRGMQQIALGQVKQFRSRLPSGKSVIGVGGIRCGHDLWKYIDCAGADGAQIGTELFRRSLPGAGRVFSEILEEYYDLKKLAVS
jgi:dihydroorotate dehydrogenase (fumarate)